MEKIFFGDEYLKLVGKVCGVYRIVFDDKWFYFGSSVDLRRRLSAWRHYLSKRNYAKNRSIGYVLAEVSAINFEIVEYVQPGVDPKIREDVYIKQYFESDLCLNLTKDAIGGKGRKKYLGYIPPPKKIKNPITPKKPVAEFDNSGKFVKIHESILAAHKSTGIKEDSIRKIFNGKLKQLPSGTFFKPVSPKGEILELPDFKVTPEKVQYILGNYDKISAAKIATHLGIGETTVRSIALGRSRKGLTGGVVFKLRKVHECIPVLQYDLQGNFIDKHDSIGLAARKYNLNRSSIQELLKGSRGRKQVGGYVFKYAS